MKQYSMKSKLIIGGVLIGNASLIYTLIRYAINNKHSNASIWFAVGLIVLAVISILAVTIVRLRKGKYEKLLSEDYYAVYEQIRDALNTTVLSAAEKRETLADVLSMLIEAQEQGRDVDDVTGGDIPSFTKRVKASFGYRSGFVFNLCTSTQFGIAFVLLLQIFIFAKDGGERSFFNTGIALSMLIMYAVMVFAVFPLLWAGMRKKNRGVSGLLIMVIYILVFMGAVMLLDNVFPNQTWARYIMDTDVSVIFSWWMLVVFAGFFVLAQGMKMLLRQRSVQNL